MSKVKDVRSKSVSVVLSDGVEREIRYTLNAMAELEEIYGSVDKAFAALETNSLKAVRNVLWAGLVHQDETLTAVQVGNLIDMQTLSDLMGSLNVALGSDMPDSDEAEAIIDVEGGTEIPNE